MDGEDDVYSTIKGAEGYDATYSCVSEFKEHSKANYLSAKKCARGLGWVFWRTERDDESSKYKSVNNSYSSGFGRSVLQEKKILVLEEITSRWVWRYYYIVQFWEPKLVDGRCYLASLDQPFVVGSLNKGSSWYRKQSVEHHYYVSAGEKEEDIGFLGASLEKEDNVILH